MYQYFVSPIIGYLLGSIPYAWIIVKLVTGKDIREEGLGRITTQHTIELAGPIFGLLKGGLDITKGFLSVFLIQYAIFPNFVEVETITVLAGLGAVLGHCYQPWLKFKGGRAFSVFLGGLIVINPWGLLIWIGWMIIFTILTKYTTIGGILSTILIGIAFTLFYYFGLTAWNHWSILIFSWGYVLILTIKSIPNLILISKGELEKGQ